MFPNRLQTRGTMSTSAESSSCFSLAEHASARLPTRFGEMRIRVYRNQDGIESVAIISRIPADGIAVPIRVHSACATAEVIGSLKCDCKSQLDYALQYISDNGGLVIYLSQEGRGVGLVNKIKAYALQDQGYDTVDANRMLGLPDDAREYQDAARIIEMLGIRSIRLLTNNPRKISDLESLGVDIQERVPMPVIVNEHSVDYLKAKNTRMGHFLDVTQPNEAISEDERPDRPLVHVNLALDDQGRTAQQNGEPINLSCDQDWRRVHELREHYSAVVVGARTWLQDSPQLTAREDRLGRPPRRQPERVIFAGRHNCTFDRDPRRTFVIGSGQTSEGAILIDVSDHDLASPLKTLRKCGLKSLLVEGGLTLLGSFIRSNAIDYLSVYVRCGSESTAKRAVRTAFPQLKLVPFEYTQVGKGILVTADFLISRDAVAGYALPHSDNS